MKTIAETGQEIIELREQRTRLQQVRERGPQQIKALAQGIGPDPRVHTHRFGTALQTEPSERGHRARGSAAA